MEIHELTLKELLFSSLVFLLDIILFYYNMWQISTYLLTYLILIRISNTNII